MGRILKRRLTRTVPQEEQSVSEVGIFVDFGSIYTKVTAIDLDEEISVRRVHRSEA
jgi:hypothetical protein